MSIILGKIWPQGVIILVVFIFFARLFFPPSVFTTPDFGRSDALHSNLPTKLLLEQSLKDFTVPLWENNIGQGFPIFAEGIMGFFFLPNIVIFAILPFTLAIPTMYLVSFTTAAVGMYLLIRKLNFDTSAALIVAIAFAFSAPMILHVQHFNYIQTASLIPLLFLTLLNFIEKKTVINATIASLIASQMFLAGFVQIYIYAVLVLSVVLLIYTKIKAGAHLIKTAFALAGIILFSMVLSSVQILPTYELVKLSTRSSGVPAENILNDFPLSPKNYLTFINPFILGKSQDGTYNSLEWGKYGIYWENTNYIGITALFLFAAGMVFLARHQKKNIFLPILASVIISILLSLGKFSPTHIFFSFPPLSFFRVPARFILLVQFLMLIIAALGANNLQKLIPKAFKFPAFCLLLVIVTADFYYYWWSYNPIGTFEKWLTQPEFAQKVKSHPGRVFSIGSTKNWNEIFTQKGWQNQEDNYLFFRNSLDQNLNILYDVSQFSMFETLPTRRYQLQTSILREDIQTEDQVIKIGSKAQNILRVANVRYIISSTQIETSGVILIDQVQKDQLIPSENNPVREKRTTDERPGEFIYYLYELENAKDLVQLYFDFESAETVGDYVTQIGNIDINKTVILENADGLEYPGKGVGFIKLQEIKNGFFAFEVENTSDAFLALSISYYPGWQAKVNGRETKIYPANINSQAIHVPKGKHSVTFEYKPQSFRIGLAISFIAHLFALLYLTGKSKFLKRLRKGFVSFLV